MEQKEIIGSANTLINRYLQGALIMAGVDQKLSFHSGRYSFANNADKTGVSRSVLSQAMGHSSVKVTEIYLNSFNDDEINEAVKGMYES